MRSGLAQLEKQTTQAMQRLENIKNVTTISSTSSVTETVPTTTTATSTITNNDSNLLTTTSNGAEQSIFTGGFLQSGKKRPNEIFDFLETLIAQSDSDDETEYPLPALDEVSHLALISHSIVAYMSHLDYNRLSKITAKISNDTNRWLAHIFRFIDATASYHTDNTEAILRAVR